MGLATFKMFKTLKNKEGWVVINDSELKNLQNILEGITADIFDFCQKNEIDVFLAYGSALGAVRHGGFIPWDDDMDLIIRRKDCKRFVEGFQREYGEKYWLHVPGKTANYSALFLKVLKKGTIVRLPEDFESDECGAFIDVFILDNEFDNTIIRKMKESVDMALKGIVSCCRVHKDKKWLLALLKNNEEAQKTIKMKAAIGAVLGIVPISQWIKMANWNRQLCKNENSKYVTSNPNHSFPREIFGTPRSIRFGKHTWSVPERVEDFLTALYGNYMWIPPVEEREQHAYVDFKL